MGADAFGLKPSKEYFCDALVTTALMNKYHPVRQYLSSLKWDGVRRVEEFLPHVTGCDDTALNRAIGMTVLIAGVRRIFTPGCKYDLLAIAEGPQGISKSTMWRALVPDPSWFTDTLEIGASSKETMEVTGGIWIAETPELGGMPKREVENTKSFVSRQIDKARLSYGKFATERPRQFICVGTTNDDKYLRDETGNRRFAPFECKREAVDVQYIIDNRDQLWAEAVVMEKEAPHPVTIDKSLWVGRRRSRGRQETYRYPSRRVPPRCAYAKRAYRLPQN